MGLLKRIRRDLMPEPSATKLITIRVPEDLLEAFTAKAKEEGQDRSSALKALMTAYLKNKIVLKA